jgi:hypothetical protein
MCLACDMEALWFAVMDARADAAAGESAPQQASEPAALLPPPERGRVGEGVAGGTDEAAVTRGESEDPHPNPPPEGGGGSKSPPRRFACEETSAE